MTELADTEAYLKKIRQTIKDSKAMIAQAELRMAETDRLLEKEGVTREQLMNLRFTDEQIEAVNAELKRRGLPPLDAQEVGKTAEELVHGMRAPNGPDTAECDGSTQNRKRKFGVMMQQFRM